MSFFQKLINQIKGVANDSLVAVASDSVAVRQSVRELQADIDRATIAVADVNAQKTLIQNRITEAKAAAKDWEDRARRAVQLNDDALATAALEQQVAEENRATKYQAQLDELTPQADKLNQLLDERREQLENARIDSDVIQASDAVASATMTAAKSLQSGGAEATLNAAREGVKTKAARADALLDLTEDKATATSRKLRALEANSNVADRLAALKQKSNA